MCFDAGGATVLPVRRDWSEVDQPRAGHPPREHSVTVHHHPRSAALVRKHLTADLSECGSRLGADLLHDAAWVATELVGNAVRHASPLNGGVIRVSWRAYRQGVCIRVMDGGSPQVPQMCRVTAESLTGRGLAIVATLSSRWGVVRTEQGRCVWAWLGEAGQIAS
ncbi:MAG: ATP-binding protein [Micromonosporaceae bacterium]